MSRQTELFNHGNDHVVSGQTLDAALAHLTWLNTTLASTSAAQQRAYIVGHVPIGMETAYANDRSVPSVLRPYWMDIFARRYQDIIDSFGEAIVAIQIFGHEHVDTFRLIGQRTVALSVPSLSTAYPRTNPTVRLWRHEVSEATPFDYDQFYLDLLTSNAHHEAHFAHAYSFREEYGLPDLTRASFEALLEEFKNDAHNGEVGWRCSAGASGALYIPARSVSTADHGFNATAASCERECDATPDCHYWQWGHTIPDFVAPLGWCYLYADCGVLTPDAASAPYHPKYTVNSNNRTAYARERRHFLSSTPLSVQPACDKYCRMEDLCDKARSGAITSNQCFSECVEDNGRLLVDGSGFTA